MALNPADRIVSHMEHWGYDFFDKPHPHSPGYGSLVVAIRRVPTHQHYDPERILLRSADDPNNPSRATLTYETRLRGEMRVCPGHVELTDLVDKRLGFFVYGGNIEAIPLPDETLFWLHSSAPILELARDGQGGPDDELAFETEALFAKLRVSWGRNDLGFMSRLAQADPINLYAGTIASLLADYMRSANRSSAFPALFALLRSEQRWLTAKGVWNGKLADMPWFGGVRQA